MNAVATEVMIKNLAQLTEALGHDLPLVFPRNVGHPVRPLALGTGRLLKEHLSAKRREKMSQFLSMFTGHPAYLHAVAAEGSYRYNLDGQAVELVSDEHRAAARKRLAQQKERRESKGNGKGNGKANGAGKPVDTPAPKVRSIPRPTNADLRAALHLKAPR